MLSPLAKSAIPKGFAPQSHLIENHHVRTNRKCILIWLDGGPSHLEMFDPKPDAPAEVRGPFGTVRTPLPGIAFSDVLPNLAKRAKQLTLIRSMTSPLGEHNLGTHYVMTGYKPSPALRYPAFGTVITHLQENRTEMPPNVAVPDHRVGGSNFLAQGFLESSDRPFEVGGDPAKRDFRVADLYWYPGMDRDRSARRRRFLESVETLAEKGKIDPQFEQAFDLLQSETARAAFDVSKEDTKTRNRYGPKSIGQCCLMARRLIEAGVSFVTVNNRGWDTHDRMVTRLKDGFNGAKVPVGLIPSLDQAVSALLDDLQARGLLDETLIVVMGEFGRTPKLNVRSGRDHWPRVFSVMMAGGGLASGVVYGESDGRGESPKKDPVNPGQLLATIYAAIGVDPTTTLQSPDGRPVSISNGQSPIADLLV